MRRPMLAGLLFALTMLVAPNTSFAQKKPHGDRYRITAEELTEVPPNVNTAADLIRTLRPLWLSPVMARNSTANLEGSFSGAREVVVYIDDLRQPNLESLQTVKASTVVELRFLDQNRAIQMRGPGHEMGIIEVTTVNKRK